MTHPAEGVDQPLQWDESMTEAKPFTISKRLVWQAWQKVKANKGAAGTDGQSLADFEANLGGNLYKLWNRMSSGSYFPPPVLRVDIDKSGGGTRTLGVPTVADRIAQTVVKLIVEPISGTCFSSELLRLPSKPLRPSGAGCGAQALLAA